MVYIFTPSAPAACAAVRGSISPALLRPSVKKYHYFALSGAVFKAVSGCGYSRAYGRAVASRHVDLNLVDIVHDSFVVDGQRALGKGKAGKYNHAYPVVFSFL